MNTMIMKPVKTETFGPQVVHTYANGSTERLLGGIHGACFFIEAPNPFGGKWLINMSIITIL